MKPFLYPIVASISLIALIILLTPIVEQVFAQTEPRMSVKQQWEMFHNTEQITCAKGYGILIKGSTGEPVCVKPAVYLRLVNRDYGEHDFSLMSKNQDFMTGIDNNIMNHPELQEDMLNDPDMIQAMQKNSQWMNHMQGKGMTGKEMMMDKYTMGCKWCPTSEKPMGKWWMVNDLEDMDEMMDKLIDDPQFREQIMEHMMGNPQFMEKLMQNEKFMQLMNP